jgi:hypothetical protein
MPVTMLFGPWAPDQADTPIQIPDTQGPLPVPCADVLNVIYTNGNYRSIASPSDATINGILIQPISVKPVNAFSYFDEVAQQETVFAGTGVGMQQLNPDGSWSIVQLITTQITALIGQALSISVGNFANNDAIRGATFKFTTGSITVVQTGVSFVAGLLSQPSEFGTIQQIGYSGVAPTFGSLINGSMFLGALVSMVDGSGLSSLSLNCATDPTASGFTTVTTNGKTFASADAAGYSYSAVTKTATWQWPGPFGFAAGTTYTVVFT